MLAYALTAALKSKSEYICIRVRARRSVYLYESARVFNQPCGAYRFTVDELALAIAHARIQGHDLPDIE